MAGDLSTRDAVGFGLIGAAPREGDADADAAEEVGTAAIGDDEEGTGAAGEEEEDRSGDLTAAVKADSGDGCCCCCCRLGDWCWGCRCCRDPRPTRGDAEAEADTETGMGNGEARRGWWEGGREGGTGGGGVDSRLNRFGLGERGGEDRRSTMRPPTPTPTPPPPMRGSLSR